MLSNRPTKCAQAKTTENLNQIAIIIRSGFASNGSEGAIIVCYHADGREVAAESCNDRSGWTENRALDHDVWDLPAPVELGGPQLLRVNVDLCVMHLSASIGPTLFREDVQGSHSQGFPWQAHVMTFGLWTPAVAIKARQGGGAEGAAMGPGHETLEVVTHNAGVPCIPWQFDPLTPLWIHFLGMNRMPRQLTSAIVIATATKRRSRLKAATGGGLKTKLRNQDVIALDPDVVGRRTTEDILESFARNVCLSSFRPQ